MKSSRRAKRQQDTRAPRTRRGFAPRPEPLEDRQLLAANWFVNASAPVTGADGSAGHPFPTIQAAVSAASAGDTVSIAAGTYAESVQVTKPLTLAGPNAGVDPNTGVRSAEAVVVPPQVGTASVIQVLADNVTIDGLTIDGDNPALDPADGTMLNDVPSFASRGVANFSSAAGTPVQVAGMTVRNDVIRNFTLFGVLGDTPAFAVSTGNVVSDNLIDNVPTASTVLSGMARGVSLEDNFYGDVTNNVITRTFQGVQAIAMINPGTAAVIAGNTIHAYDTGINLNLHDAGGATYSVSNNQLAAEAGADATSTGIRVGQVLHTDIVTLTGNDISGFQTGVELRYTSAQPGVSVTGGTIANVGVGVLIDNDNPPAGDVPPKATEASLLGVTITGASVAGIEIRDNLSNNVTAATPFTAPVTLTVDAQTVVTDSAEGVKLVMPPTSQYQPHDQPTVTLVAPGAAPTLTLTSTPDANSTDRDPTFTYTTTDHLTTPGDMLVDYSIDGNGALPASGGSITLHDLEPGTHTLGLVATDQAGATVNQSFTWTVTQAQTPAPSLALSAESDTGALNDDHVTSDNTPTFGGGALAGSTVALYATGGNLSGTTLLGAATAAADGSWSFTVGGPGSVGLAQLPDGQYTLFATATVAGDLESGPSPTSGLVVDTTTPAVTVTSGPADGTTQTTATFGYAATQSSLTASSPLTYQYQLDGGTASTVTANPLVLTGLTAGPHTLTLYATDLAGNQGSTSYAWTIAPGQPSPPTLALAAGSDTGVSSVDGVTNDNTPSFVGTAPAGSTVLLYATAAFPPGPRPLLNALLNLLPPITTPLGVTTAAQDGSWSFTVGGPGSAPGPGHTKLADGAYTITAKIQAPGGGPHPIPGPALPGGRHQTAGDLARLQCLG